MSEISITNVSGSAIQTNVAIGRGSSLYFTTSNLTIAARSTVTVISRETALYMEEGDYLQANTSAANGAHIGISYEITS